MSVPVRVCFVLVGLFAVLGFAVLVVVYPSPNGFDSVGIACIATLEFIGAWLLLFGLLGRPLE